jgi:NhaA family Na+:H+ antiporter
MKKNKPQLEEGVIYAPWERTFTHLLSPFEEFIHRQTTSGILLMGAAILALVLANSDFAAAYQHLTHTMAGFHIGGFGLELSLHHWVNDALMALFFFVVGMELKREMLVGELADVRKSALPIIAAIGGMVVPALIFFAFNPDGDASRGWGIPMATDIAFAVGALALLANRVPKALVTFLVALAIVDDLGAVLVIALFYTSDLSLQWLGISALLVAVLVIFNFAGLRRAIPYFCVAVLLWYAMLQSGVHATLAGVLGAFTVPARPKYHPGLFSRYVRELMSRFDSSYKSGANIMTNEKLETVVQALEDGVKGVQTPLQSLERDWHLPVAFLVIPVFALFNAGVPLQLSTLGEAMMHPVTLGVLLGLVVGKFIGITGACWLAIKLGIAELPTGTRFVQVAGVAVLGGIGFTMSIFIAELGFANHPDYLVLAKTGILGGSLLSGIIGLAWLWLAAKPSGSEPSTPGV